MLAHLIQAIFACSHTIFRSIINITLYSLLSRIFLNWFRFNSFVTFLCTAWCITKITKYIRRLWLNARLQNKKPTEKILVNELIWKSDDNNDNENDFKDNWNKLIKDEYEHFFSGVVRIPFENGWVCIGVMVIVNYLTNNAGFSYLSALFRTVSCVVLVCCGSSIRYQTLINRDRQEQQLQQPVQDNDTTTKYLVLSNNGPVAAYEIQTCKLNNKFTVVFYSCHSKYIDYITDIGMFSIKNILNCVSTYCHKYGCSQCQIIWSLPMYKNEWTQILQTNRFKPKTVWTEFSYLPLVESTVTQYQYEFILEEHNTEISNTDDTENKDVVTDQINESSSNIC